MKAEKGQPGYIRAQKNKLLIQTCIGFGIVIALLIIGYTQTGTKLNWLTFIAILGCLPAARILVELIAIFPHKTVDPEKVRELKEKAPLLTTAYDLIVTSKDSIMPIDAIVISDGTVCGYSSSKKIKEEEAAAHIKDILAENRYNKVTVKIFKNYVAFLSRAEGMNSISKIEQEDTKKKEQRIRRIILNISI